MVFVDGSSRETLVELVNIDWLGPVDRSHDESSSIGHHPVCCLAVVPAVGGVVRPEIEYGTVCLSKNVRQENPLGLYGRIGQRGDPLGLHGLLLIFALFGFVDVALDGGLFRGRVEFFYVGGRDFVRGFKFAFGLLHIFIFWVFEPRRATARRTRRWRS